MVTEEAAGAVMPSLAQPVERAAMAIAARSPAGPVSLLGVIRGVYRRGGLRFGLARGSVLCICIFFSWCGNSPGGVVADLSMSQPFDVCRTTRRDRRDSLQASLDGMGLTLF